MIDHVNINKKTIREKILHFIRVLSPVLAVFVLVFLIVWPLVHKSTTSSIHTSIDTGDYTDMKTSITNSTVMGTSTSDDRYSIHTDKIYEYEDSQNKKDDTYRLESSKMIQEFANGGVLRINGTYGTINRTKSLMSLSNGVYMINNDLEKSYTTNLSIDIKKRFIENHVPFMEWGKNGFFTATNGMSYDLHKKVVILKGKSRVVLLADSLPSTNNNENNDKANFVMESQGGK